VAFDPSASLLMSLDTNDRITRYLVEAIDPDAWRAPTLDGKGRDIAGIVAHIHNVRLMWIKAVGAALSSGEGVKGFKPDVTGFVGYHIAHDAHHRGQIAMLARQSGHPLPQKIMFGTWEWGSPGTEIG
jgi:uncharacterized damage-inducible protein DinB